MVGVSVRVQNGAASMKVRVVAASAERAASLVGAEYPAENVELIFPPHRSAFSCGRREVEAANLLAEAI